MTIDFETISRILEKNGIPTFRTADEALKSFNLFCTAVMGICERSEVASA
jgi:hypothetical protein